MDWKKLAIFSITVLAVLATALPAASSFVPAVGTLSADSSTIMSATPLDGTVLRAQQLRDPTGAAGISRQEVTGVETPVTTSYPYYPYTLNPVRMSNWWGGWGWGGWGWPMWNSWGGYW